MTWLVRLEPCRAPGACRKAAGLAFKLKSQREIELMRGAGRLVHRVLERLREMTAPGVSTAALDAEAERMCREAGAACLFRGVPGVGGPFPGNICCSIDEQVVHGIPSERCIREGELVSIDFGVRLAGYCGDAAITVAVGEVGQAKRRLVEAAERLLAMAIEMMAPGRRWSEIARAMQACAEDAGFGVVRKYVGHGIGTEMWEDPKVPNFVSPELLRRDIVLREGLVLAVEPMVNMGTEDVKVLEDGWTVVTADGRPSAHCEHMLAVTADGVDVLTDGR